MDLKLTDYQQNLLNTYVTNIWYVKAGEKTTVAVIKITNGFEIVGSSACVNPADFNAEIGEHYALVESLGKLDAFIGFHRTQANYNIQNLNVTVNTESVVKNDDVEATVKQIMRGIKQIGAGK